MRLFARVAIAIYLASSAYAQTFNGVFTWHNDNGRTGQYLKESVLTPQNVNSATFGKVLSYPVDGEIFGQPLYVPNVQINGHLYNVVYVVTENNSVVALETDNLHPLWHTTFSNPSAGVTAVNCKTSSLSCNVYPIDGVTATPVIDPTTSTMYIVAHTLENGVFYVRLHALDITTGKEKFGGPVEVTATAPGTGVGSKNGMITLNLQNDLVRPAVLLLKNAGPNGTVYIAPNGYPHSWVLAYDAVTLQQLSVFVSSPNGTLAGIWQSGAGLAADKNNHIYLATGDGTFDASTGGLDYGDTLLQLDSSLAVVDYFTPMDQACRFTSDMDLSSGGPMLLPPQSGAVPNEVLIAGKGGTPCDANGLSPIYLVNDDDMGQYDATLDHVVEEISGSTIGYWSSPAYWQGAAGAWVYYAGVTADHATGDYLKAYSLTNGLLSVSPTSQSSNLLLNGGTPSISAKGSTNGILWLISREDYLDTRPGVKPATLYAYDATNVATQLYSSAASGLRDQAGCGAKFQTPTIANGQVFVGTGSELDVYGVIGQPLPAYPVTLSQPCADFGMVETGSTSTAQNVVLTNTGAANLTINSIAPTGQNVTDFIATNNCPASLAPGGNCTITLTFTPLGTGPRYASVIINDNAITPQGISVVGYGIATISLTPTILEFGDVTVGQSSSPQTATFQNSGTSSVNVTVTMTGQADFSQTNNCPASVPAGGSCTINVTFKPVAIGLRHGYINLTNSLEPPLRVTLRGTGD